MSSQEQSSGDFLLRNIKQTVGIFSIVGVGLGLTGAITLLQVGGSGIFGGILALVLLIFTFLISPILAVITGLRIGEKNGRSKQTYLIGAVGAVGGHFSMMLIIVLILSIVISTLSGDGGTGSTAAQSAATSNGGLEIGEYIVPIIAVAVPTAITGSGGVFLAGDQNHRGDIESKTRSVGIQRKPTLESVPVRKIGVAIIITVVIGMAVVFMPILFPPSADDLAVNGNIEFGGEDGDIIEAGGTVENPRDEAISTEITYEFMSGEETIDTATETIFVPSGEFELSYEVSNTDDIEAYYGTEVEENDKYKMKYIIDGEVVETVSE